MAHPAAVHGRRHIPLDRLVISGVAGLDHNRARPCQLPMSRACNRWSTCSSLAIDAEG